MSTPASPFGAILKHAGADPLGRAPANETPDGDDFARPSIQRTVAAAGAPSVVPVNAFTNAFHHPFRVAGSATAEDEASAADESVSEEQSMPNTTKPARKGRGTKATSPQFQICAALLAHGDLTVEQLKKKVKLADDKALANGLYGAKNAGRIERLADGTCRLTDAGKEWLSGGANLKNQQATQHSPKKVVTGKRARRGADVKGRERERLGVVATRGGKVIGGTPPPPHLPVCGLQRWRVHPRQGRCGDRARRGRARVDASLPRTHGRAACGLISR